MISYAPLDDYEDEKMLVPKQYAISKQQQQQQKQPTECNMVVMIFIGAVLFLALMDSSR